MTDPSHSTKITYPIDKQDVESYFDFKYFISDTFRLIPRVAGVCAVVLIVVGGYVLAVKFIL